MTDEDQSNSDSVEPTPQSDPKPDRIAKVMARAGIASRREAERMIIEGRVTVNGTKIDSPALDVLPTDRINVDGKRLDAPQETRLWLYYKPIGLVTSEADEKGRQTVFDALPRDLPRVMTIGRLDLNSEGLLLLTNDGELKRRLELPSTGWLRRYRVRVNGTPNDLTFAPLRRGVTIDGEEFAPMEIKLDSQQGANAWLTVGIREGKNREIRRTMAHVGLQVNRLIRIGYGPFKLVGLEKNQVSEVKRRVLRDQLGGLLTGEATEKEREMRPRGADRDARGPARPRRDDDGAPRRSFRAGGPRPDRDEAEGERPRRSFAAGGSKRDRDDSRGGDAGDRPRRSFGAARGDRDEVRKGAGPRRSFGDGAPRGDRDEARGGGTGDRPRRSYGEGAPRGDRDDARKGAGPRRSFGDGAPRGDRDDARKGGTSDRPRRSFGNDSRDGDRPRRFGDKPGRPAREDSRGDSGDRKPRGPGAPRQAGDDRKPRWNKPSGSGSGEGFSGGDRRSGGNEGKPFRNPRAEGKPGGADRGHGKPSGKPGGRPAGKPGGGFRGKPRGK